MKQNANNGRGLAIASLVLGIISIVLAFIMPLFVGFVCGIVGIVLAVQARKKEKTGMATAGLVCSIIGTIFGAISVICVVACVGAAISAGFIDSLGIM